MALSSSCYENDAIRCVGKWRLIFYKTDLYPTDNIYIAKKFMSVVKENTYFIPVGIWNCLFPNKPNDLYIYSLFEY